MIINYPIMPISPYSYPNPTYKYPPLIPIIHYNQSLLMSSSKNQTKMLRPAKGLTMLKDPAEKPSPKPNLQ